MISIIICSRTQAISEGLSMNIKNTVGCEHELIVINNSENAYSIFEAYNLGIERSKGNFLCFIHDDILFHTDGWGLIIQHIFSENIKIGLIGVAGAKIKTKMPSAWWDCAEEDKVLNIIQHKNNGEKETNNSGFQKESITEVVAIDGVFMAMRKDKRIRFDTEMNGFHNYDLNISFEYNKNGYKIMVTNQILIEHFSSGTLNEAWIDSTYKIHNLYKSILPLSIPNTEINKKNEMVNAVRIINKCIEYNRNEIAVTIWGTFFLMHPLSKYHFTFWKKIIKNKLC